MFMLSCYAVAAMGIGHEVCRFDRSDYDDNPKLPIYESMDEAPNVTTTVVLSFIMGLLLHLTLFTLNIFFEPYFMYTEPVVPKGNFLELVDPVKEKARL